MRTLNLKEISGSHAASSVEKALQARAIPAGGLGKSGERVILFYYGVGNLCTAVAYKDAGTAPANQISGVVSQFERKQHLLPSQALLHKRSRFPSRSRLLSILRTGSSAASTNALRHLDQN